MVKLKPKANIHHIVQDLAPSILTIFGATGSLSADYLLPALHHMDTEGLLPANFKLVCVGRREMTTEQFLSFIVKKSKNLKGLKSPKARKHFLSHLTYFQGDLENPESFVKLAKLLSDHDSQTSSTSKKSSNHICYNRLYYFATSPQLFASIAHTLKDSGLLIACQKHERKVRVLVEKPFGFNLKSAQTLNQLLLKYFTEEQIYRIDHYVGKETVQNLMVVRFANSLFEPLWNKDHIDHIEISVLEKDGVGQRAEFYDQTGALKDFVQNHILQMLALISMNEPYNLTAKDIRNEKLKILSALRPFNAQTIKTHFIKGQYQNYAKDVRQPGSQTETFTAFKAFIDLPRWQDVPFYIRTGKNLTKKLTEISIHFKEPVRCLFKNCAPNVLTFRIQPDESVHLQINNKIPGFGIELHQGDYEFGYQKAFMREIPGAYERLLLDFIEGDQRLFIRSDEIEAAWKFIDSITDNWKNEPLYKYKAGTNGPAEAEEFIEKDLRKWWTE